jgi:hypothetical protein
MTASVPSLSARSKQGKPVNAGSLCTLYNNSSQLLTILSLQHSPELRPLLKGKLIPPRQALEFEQKFLTAAEWQLTRPQPELA